MKFALSVGLLVHTIDASTEAQPPLLDRLDDVYGNLVDQEAAHPSLLDSDLNATLTDPSHATAALRLTLETSNEDEAVAVGLSCLRAALHAAGIYTPYWDAEGMAAYSVAATEETVEATPLPA